MINIKKVIGIVIVFLGVSLFMNSLTPKTSSFYLNNNEDLGPEKVGIKINEINTISTSRTITEDSTYPNTSKNLINKKPIKLLIPSLKINANIQYVGMNDKGNMGTPKGFEDVAWYEPGTIPGEIGSAVIAGHVDNAKAQDGVFKELGNINKGDDVYIKRIDETTIHFKVKDIKIYPYEDAPAKEIFESTDGKKLNLISCAGRWIPELKTYDKRVVIYSELFEN